MIITDRAEAGTLLRQMSDLYVIDLCRDSFVLMKPKAKNSQGYELHIKTKLDWADKICMQEIINIHKLEVKEEAEYIILYNPKTNQ